MFYVFNGSLFLHLVYDLFWINSCRWCEVELKLHFLHTELWTEVCDTVQEAGIKTTSKKKKCKKAKWCSEEALQIAEKGEVKGEGEKERYTHLNAEFQRIARRDKKAFLSDQCKEIEEYNRMRKTTDLFKKIRDTKEYFMERWAQ